ncbi:Glycosyl transferase group 1 [uncultured Desulfovibrio sp.]|uniref:Glycosyl transferase group 1 n=2 Tax=Desulfovibrio TaxID=872 RepID=A0A212L7F6_9BACT|nr:Glycosyl transferase group 1 [uncultured Desulfovibrio sp.]VZH34209.1 Glycosyl transferase group 1 [Desulfovibrio sp. 86]
MPCNRGTAAICGEKMHIVIDGHSLGILGGIERVVCDLASAMVQRGHRVSIFISEPLPEKPIYAVDKRVRFVVYAHGGRQKHLAEFRRQILACAPDVCISPAADRRHFPWCAALWNSGIPLVVSEHSTPEDVESRIWNRPERLAVMAAADAIHMLRTSCLPSLPDTLLDKAHVIPNAVNLPLLEKSPKDHPIILSMGRLERDKQNHILLDAFAMLAPDFPQWRLEVWGGGPEQSRLKRQAHRLGLKGRAHICGLTTRPEACYASADILCQPSRHEAFPGAVIESMAAGLPVVGFAQCSGVNELVRNGTTGLLAPEMTAVSLAETLRTLMQSTTKREHMGSNGREATMPYSPQLVYDAWEKLLECTALCKGKTNLREAAFSTNEHNGLELHPELQLLRHCIARPNVLVADGNLLRQLVFSSPWLTQRLRPFYSWLKGSWS